MKRKIKALLDEDEYNLLRKAVSYYHEGINEILETEADEGTRGWFYMRQGICASLEDKLCKVEVVDDD